MTAGKSTSTDGTRIPYASAFLAQAAILAAFSMAFVGSHP
jgi:hypothetical protein